MSDQYVRVPRELLECIAEKDLCNRTLGELMQWAREVLIRHDAATAEDVRAVVDEPVGYAQMRDLEKVCGRNVVHVGVLMAPKPQDGFLPLYHQPQRQVVMPERIEPTQDEPYMTEASHGWNACLDEFARLNK